MKQLQILTKQLFESKTSVHILFVMFMLSVNILWLITSTRLISFLPYVLLSIVIQFSSIYTGRWIYNKWFRWNYIGSFLGYSIISILLLSGVALVVFNLISSDAFYGVKYSLISFFTVLPSYLLGVFFSMIRASLQNQIKEAQITQRQQESELTLLISQLSPHFLFNTLNNLYGLSITQHHKMPALLLKLSDLLRYSLYEVKKPLVLLSDEINYINNYIELEKIRIGDRLTIKSQIDLEDIRIKIAPMLLIIFIENAFKHAKNTYSHKIFIEMNLRADSENIHFMIKNSFPEFETKDIDEHSGLGLVNAIKRLELLYPNQHHYNQNENNGWYNVDLMIKVK